MHITDTSMCHLVIATADSYVAIKISKKPGFWLQHSPKLLQFQMSLAEELVTRKIQNAKN
jgi:hypothetical protein